MKEYRQLEALIATMNLPTYRRKVVNNTDIRWLHRSLHIKNSSHKNYEQVKALLEKLL